MPEEKPAPTSAPEPTPTVTPEPTPAAPVAAPTAPKKPKTGLIVGICATAVVAIVGAVIAIIVINNNKPKEPNLGDLMNSALDTLKSSGNDLSKLYDNLGKDDDDDDFDWGKLFDDDEEEENDGDEDDEGATIDWGKLFDDEDDDKDDDKDSSTSKITSCKDAFDCMEKLDKGYTKAEIDKITGITGKPAYEGSTSSYEWEFPNGDKLKYYISEYSLDVEVEYEKNNYKDSSVDFSSYKSIESNIKSGDVKYKDLVKEFGTEGKLFKRSDYRNGYFWVNANGGYIEANVSNETQQVQSAFGIIR
jgi:hypothetical protein